MEKKSQAVHEQDILDWIIFSGVTSEKELLKKFRLSKRSLRSTIHKLEKNKIVKRKKSLLGVDILFNHNSEAGKREKTRLLPSVDVIGGEKKFKTSLDVLKNLVDRFGSVGLNRATRFFNTRGEAVEDWAKILQSQGLITIYYPIVGEPLLLRKGEKQSIVNRTLIVCLILLLMIILYYSSGG